MRLACGLIAIALAAGEVQAQTASIPAQEVERARRLLNSANWADKAWGAYFAGRLHSEELTPALVEQFRYAVPDSSSQGEPRAYVDVLFDAAIEAGISVPAGLLEPFAKKWSDPVLILLARSNDRDSEELLLTFCGEKAGNINWLTANNLLAARRSQPWYEGLLGAITLTHQFVVTDPNHGWGVMGGGLGGGAADGIAAAPKGFPPVTYYHLENYARDGDVLLVRGPRDSFQRYDVYYERIVVPAGKQVGSGYATSSPDRTAARAAYVGMLGGMSAEDSQRLFHGVTDIPLSTVDAFVIRANTAMDAQAQGVRALIREIAKSGLQAPAITLRITPEVQDRRETSSVPLPAVPQKDVDLH